MSDSDEQLIEKNKTDAAKPHTVSEEVRDLGHLWKQHGPPILIAICIGALLGGGITYYRNARAKRLTAAGAELFEARSVAAVHDWISRYSRTKVAPLGSFRLAEMFFDEGRYGDALNLYESFVSTHTRHPLATPARMGRCQSLEALGRLQDALAAYEEFATSYADHFLLPEALLGKARCLRQLHQTDEARRLYEDIVLKYTDTPWAIRAEEGIIGLERASATSEVAAPSIPGWANPTASGTEPIKEQGIESLQFPDAGAATTNAMKQSDEPNVP